MTPTYVHIEHVDKDTECFNTKTIQHNQPISVVGELMVAEGIQCCGKRLVDYSTEELIQQLKERDGVSYKLMDNELLSVKVDPRFAKRYTILKNEWCRGVIDKMKPKDNSKLSISIDMDSDNLVKKLNAIAKHAKALADELEEIDKSVCPDCGDDLTTTTLHADGKPLINSTVCDHCDQQ